MENEIENTFQNYETEISTYECLSKFGEPLLNSIIKSLSCLLYTSPSPRDRTRSRMPSSA